MTLSDKLKDLRESREWSQQYVGKLMSIDRSTISRYENGKNIPSYQTVIQFAEIYQVDKDYLVSELDELVANNNSPKYILKENQNDKDLALILELIHQEPVLKEILIDIHLMTPHRRGFFLEVLKAATKAQQKIRVM